MKPLAELPPATCWPTAAHDYAEMLFASGDHAAAAELMLGALELAPDWALGWFRMGEMHEAAGALDQAAQAWRMALKLDPDDRAGAALKLELIGRAPASDAPPGAFVEALFDQYAAKFRQGAGRQARLPRAGASGRGNCAGPDRARFAACASISAAAPA